jgi:hypothetical protein
VRAFAQGLLGALALVAALLLVLFASAAHAQVKDKPILALPTNPALVVIDINATEQKACAVWWERDTDPYGDWHLAKAFCEGVACVGVTTDLPKMIANRTRDVTAADVARCMAKLPHPPPPVWTVAPSSTGKRPAYVLKPDGTRGAQSGYIDTTITGNGKTAANWCRCDRMRSKETTSSTYCAPVWVEPPATESEPARRVVTLCRKTG